MEPQILGKIEFEQIPASRGLRRFAEKRIKKWIANHLSVLRKNNATYFVEFSREGAGHTFYCGIKVLLGGQVWIGQNYQGGLHQALIQCLSNQMTPMPALA